MIMNDKRQVRTPLGILQHGQVLTECVIMPEEEDEYHFISENHNRSVPGP